MKHISALSASGHDRQIEKFTDELPAEAEITGVEHSVALDSNTAVYSTVVTYTVPSSNGNSVGFTSS
jgi:hypothetical protein